MEKMSEETTLSPKKKLKLAMREAIAAYHQETGDTIENIHVECVSIADTEEPTEAKDVSIGYFKAYTSF